MWLERRYARTRQYDETDRDVILAWQVMRIKVLTQNHQRLPDLRGLLTRRSGAKQTAAEQRGVLHALSAAYGIPLQFRPTKGVM